MIATATATTYSDTGLTPQTTFTYSIAAFDAAGNSSAASAPASATTPAGSPPPPHAGGLVAAYRFGEGVGTATADASTNGNDGTLVNGPSWTSGKYGGAINFDGVNDFVQVADNASLDLGRTGTVEAWVKLDTLNRWHGIVAKGSANNDPSHNYAIELTSSNRWICILGNGASRVTLQSPSMATSNQYYHVACTWDGTTAQLYVDGTLSVSTSQLVTPAGNAAPSRRPVRR